MLRLRKIIIPLLHSISLFEGESATAQAKLFLPSSQIPTMMHTDPS